MAIFPATTRKRYFSTCFGLIFIFLVSFYDMQSEINNPHTTILNIQHGRRGGGGGRIEEDISSLSQTKKQLIFEKGKKSNCEARPLL